MLSTTEAPDSLDNVNSQKVSDELRDFVTELASDVEECRSDRAAWENRQDEYTRKRYGIRSKKTFPWLGAANFVLPQIDSDINRLKPAYVNLAYGISPIVLFEPYGPEDVEPARLRESLFDWRMRTQVKFFREYNLGIDYMLSRGFTIFKTAWKFATRKYVKYLDLTDLDQEIIDAIFMPEVTDDVMFHIIAEEMLPDLTFQENVDAIKEAIAEFRQGETKFELTFIEKYENRADVKACDPREDISFPIGTTDIQKAQFIDYRFWVTKNQLKIEMENGRFLEYSDDDIDSWATKSFEMTTADNLKAVRDGVVMMKKNEDLILCHEVCSWFDVDGDGILEKVITTYPDAAPKDILRFIENPYDHGEFPYDVVRREFNDDEIMSSRGIPALDDDFQTGISTLFNQDIDHGTIMTTPTVVARRNSVKNLRNIRYVPGQVVETENGAADYSVIQNTNLGQSNKFNSMQYLKSWANDRIGNITAAISQINNAPGSGQQGQKTAKEVSAIEAGAGQLQSLDLMVFQQQMIEVYEKIDSLYQQFGDEEEYVSITGQRPQKISRKETQGKFNMIANGRLDNTNPMLRAQKVLNLIQLFANDPDIRQYELKKMYIDDVDYRLSSRILLSPEEIAKRNQAQTIAQANEKTAMLQEQMGVRKISDSLELEKEWKLSQIQGKKYAED